LENQIKNEMTYLVIFSALKKLLENGNISKEVFNRLNCKNAQQQGCKEIVV